MDGATLYKNAVQRFARRVEGRELLELCDADLAGPGLSAFAFVRCRLCGVQLCAPNLAVRELDLSGNLLATVDFVAFLPRLEFLQLQGNPVVSYAPLAGLRFLQFLYVNAEDAGAARRALEGRAPLWINNERAAGRRGL